MHKLLDQMRDQETRTRMGHKFEALTNEVFQVIRWVLIVGFANFLANTTPLVILDLLYWMLATLLVAYIASRFLLRPEIRLVPHPERRWQGRLQSALNLAFCLGLCALVLWAIHLLTQAVAAYRAGAIQL